MKPQCLSKLQKGEIARIVTMDQDAPVCQRLMNFGVLPDKQIRYIKPAPMGDPLEFEVEGRAFSVRKTDACRIKVLPVNGL